MRHLTPEEFVDLAEGARAEASAPHLQACDACRRQLAELRATMSAAADIDAPEPSPLFWDHFSARVARRGRRRRRAARGPGSWASREARDASRWRSARPRRWRWSWRSRSAHAAPPAGPRGCTPSAIEAAARAGGESGLTFPDDPSLGLVASLAAGYDWDAASEAGPDDGHRADRHGDRRSVAGRARGARAAAEAGNGDGPARDRYTVTPRGAASDHAEIAPHPVAAGDRDRRRRRRGRVRPRSPARPAAADAGSGGGPACAPGEIQRMFDAYALMQAQEQLKISDEQYGRFLTALQGAAGRAAARTAGAPAHRRRSAAHAAGRGDRRGARSGSG